MKLTRKSIGRIAASFVATAMLATMAIVPASAAEDKPITSIDVSKIVTTDGDTYAPATSFDFTVTEGAAAEDFDDGTNIVDVTAGVTGGLGTLQDDGTYGFSITSTPNTTNPTSNSYTFDGSMNVNANAFTKPGVYHYVVTETTGTYEGIDYSKESYDVYVYVVNANAAGTELKVNAVIAFKGDTKQQAITFTNDYGKDNDGTHDVLVKKVVNGTLANMNDTFSFTVKVKGATGEYYKVVYTQKGVEKTTFVAEGDTGITVDGIGNNDTIRIYGLSKTDTYTVTENDGVSQGYTVTDTDDNSADGTVTGNATTDVVETTTTVDNEEVTVATPTATITNTKTASTPTGIMMDIAPYAVLVVIAAAGCFIFLRKRHAKED